MALAGCLANGMEIWSAGRLRTVDARERFEEALAKKLMELTGIPTIIIQRPEDEEEAVYRNGTLAEVIGLGGAMALEESFVHCVAREGDDWDCAEFIWSPAQPSLSPVPGTELQILGEYLERRHFLIGPPADTPVQQ